MLDAYREQLRAICQTYGVRRPERFGSATRTDFDPDTSDYDFFVDFGDQPVEGSFKRYMGLKFDLEALLGRPVDLVEASAVTNPYFLRAAAASRREVYAAWVCQAPGRHPRGRRGCAGHGCGQVVRR
jgi:predicted nucleotidyltransferase